MLSLSVNSLTALSTQSTFTNITFNPAFLNAFPGRLSYTKELLLLDTSAVDNNHDGVVNDPYHEHHDSPSKATTSFLGYPEYIYFQRKFTNCSC